jgi:acyl transferase domain-containing protein
MKQDLAAFDAPFFSTSVADAEVMDPQHRVLLEHTYKAIDNAGMSMESVSGSRTSVYAGCFTTDWNQIGYKDGERCPTTAVLGIQACIGANRISWFFNFTGNSANIDTACSSSLVSLDLGCKGLISGEEDMVSFQPVSMNFQLTTCRASFAVRTIFSLRTA